MIPTAQVNNGKNRWMGVIRVKISCVLNDMVKRVERQLMGQETIFEKHLSDKGLVSEVHKHTSTSIRWF